MGLFDKVKQMKDAVTGGSAKVFVQADAPKLGEPFTVTIRATSTGGEVKFDRVYLKVRGVEMVDLHDRVSFTHGGESHSENVRVKKSATTFSQEYNVAQAGSIAPDESDGWTFDVTLPANALPAFKGQYCRHYYAVWAGLDCFGNDPDSGWVELHLES